MIKWLKDLINFFLFPEDSMTEEEQRDFHRGGGL